MLRVAAHRNHLIVPHAPRWQRLDAARDLRVQASSRHRLEPCPERAHARDRGHNVEYRVESLAALNGVQNIGDNRYHCHSKRQQARSAQTHMWIRRSSACRRSGGVEGVACTQGRTDSCTRTHWDELRHSLAAPAVTHQELLAGLAVL